MTDTYVVDSSVLVRWFVDQPGFEHARDWQQRALTQEVELIAPAIARWELGNVLLKKGVRAGRLTDDDLVDAMSLVEAVGVEMVEFDLIRLQRVARLASALGTSFFDAAFTDLAVDRTVPLVTADVRHARAIAGRVSTDVLRGVTGQVELP